jgi:alpha-amylase/alpha-mannosidase (GH57 family)
MPLSAGDNLGLYNTSRRGRGLKTSCDWARRLFIENPARIMNRYICIHGHFYQPPRENPWLEYVELQDSAYPCHDWNERITAECYAPNGRPRILNQEGKIAELMNNYSWISFNVGPSLLAWLAERRPDVYQKILEGDRESATYN